VRFSCAASNAIICSYCAATGVVTLIVICHRRGFRGDGQAWLHSTPAMGADGITALAKERAPPHCPQIWGDV
jgi:hypothetical protein